MTSPPDHLANLLKLVSANLFYEDLGFYVRLYCEHHDLVKPDKGYAPSDYNKFIVPILERQSKRK